MIFILFAILFMQKPTEKPKAVILCTRIQIQEDRQAETWLECGKNKDGNPLVLAIPDTVYQFPRGDKFRMHVFSETRQVFDPEDQPEGSVVRVTGPCAKPNKISYPRLPLQQGPCNPELTAK